MIFVPSLMSPVGPLPPAPRHTDAPRPARSYTVLVFDEFVPTPWAILVEADNDAEAMALARSLHPLKRRELWCRHRLIGEIR